MKPREPAGLHSHTLTGEFGVEAASVEGAVASGDWRRPLANSIPYSDEHLIEILEATQTIAVVGLGSSPERTAYRVALYLQQAGYTIIPIHPTATDVLGQTVYPNLAAVPVPVDVVDIFRSIEFVPG